MKPQTVLKGVVAVGASIAAITMSAILLSPSSEPARGSSPSGSAATDARVGEREAELLPVSTTVSAVFGEKSNGVAGLDSIEGTAAFNEVVDAVSQVPTGVPEGLLPGHADLSEGRVLLADLGRSSRTIFAFPTDKGRLCAGLTDFTSGCLEGFNETQMAIPMAGDPDQAGRGDPLIVWGIVPDAVVAVRVQLGGDSFPTTLENNAFFFEASDAATPPSALRGVTIELSDGTQRTIEMGIAGGIDDIVPFDG